MGRGDRRIVLAALVVGLLGTTWIIHTAVGPSNFRLLSVQPIVFVETKLSGEQIPHQAYQAHVGAYPGAEPADMSAYAERLFSQQLRDMADRDGKTQVWITFYLDRAIRNGTALTKTFRVIYVRDATGWRPADRQPAQNAGAQGHGPEAS